MTPATVGQRIQTERKRQGLSQEDVARALECSVYTISHVERDLYKKVKTVRAICDVLGMDADELLAIEQAAS